MLISDGNETSGNDLFPSENVTAQITNKQA